MKSQLWGPCDSAIVSPWDMDLRINFTNLHSFVTNALDIATRCTTWLCLYFGAVSLRRQLSTFKVGTHSQAHQALATVAQAIEVSTYVPLLSLTNDGRDWKLTLVSIYNVLEGVARAELTPPFFLFRKHTILGEQIFWRDEYCKQLKINEGTQNWLKVLTGGTHHILVKDGKHFHMDTWLNIPYWQQASSIGTISCSRQASFDSHQFAWVHRVTTPVFSHCFASVEWAAIRKQIWKAGKPKPHSQVVWNWRKWHESWVMVWFCAVWCTYVNYCIFFEKVFLTLSIIHKEKDVRNARNNPVQHSQGLLPCQLKKVPLQDFSEKMRTVLFLSPGNSPLQNFAWNVEKYRKVLWACI